MATVIRNVERAHPGTPSFNVGGITSFFYPWTLGVEAGHDEFKSLPFKIGRRIGQIAPWKLVDYLGAPVQIGWKNEWTIGIGMPTPAEVIQHLELKRQELLKTIGELLASPEEFIRGIPVVTEQPGRRRSAPVTSFTPEMEAVVKSGQAAESMLRSIAGTFVITTQLLLYLRKRYDIRVANERGWWQGRELERDVMLTKLPLPARWNKRSLEIYQNFAVAIGPADEAFCRPTPGGIDLTGVRHEGAQLDADLKRDPLRMLFYLSLPTYSEVRYLHGKLDAYGYLAIVLEGQRLILDTERKEHAIRLLSGRTVDQMLEVAIGTKQEIDKSGCSLRVIHSSDWQNTIRKFAV